MPTRVLRSIVVVPFLLLVPILAAGARAAIAGADNPKAFTEREFRQALLAYNRATTVEVYRRNLLNGCRNKLAGYEGINIQTARSLLGQLAIADARSGRFSGTTPRTVASQLDDGNWYAIDDRGLLIAEYHLNIKD